MGSTSVPGLPAKPIIDMIAVVESRQDFDPLARSLGVETVANWSFPSDVSFTVEPLKRISSMYLKKATHNRSNLCFRDSHE